MIPIAITVTSIVLSAGCVSRVQPIERPSMNCIEVKALPSKPQPKVIDKKFLLAMAVLEAAKTADGITTQRSLNQGGIEINPIFGRHPSSARLAGVNAAYFAGEFAQAYFLKKWGRGKWWSKLWLIEPSYQAQEHIRFAIQNAKMHR